MLNFEVASISSFRDIPTNHFVIAEAAAPDIDDSIKRKSIRVSLSNIRGVCSELGHR